MDKSNEYRKLIEAIELEDLHVLGLRSSRAVDLTWPLKVQEEFDPGTATQVDGKIRVESTFRLEARCGEAPEPSIQIEALWLVTYSLAQEYEGPVPEEVLGDFVRRNVPVNLLPQIRSVVMTVTSQMGLPPLVLKTYKIILG